MDALRGDSVPTIEARSLATVQETSFRVEPVIETHNLSKTFRSFHGKKVSALQDVTIRIEAGIIFGLIGQNGAGKIVILSGVV
jgi:ABC-type glutathione transport system ATPase component